FRRGLANASGRIEFNIVLFMDWSFASGCSQPRLSTTQLPSATYRPVLLSGEDFHPTIGAYSQAHSFSPFGTDMHPIRRYSSTPSLRPARFENEHSDSTELAEVLSDVAFGVLGDSACS
ncbi:MAG TPA: hypothetical protein VE641_16760, partial [Chthoniobacterales bacterium]|nr:hypothetical protein [Chthoniobacterales bacterium]